MPQLSLYINDVMYDEMKGAASAEGLSLSRYAAEAIRNRLDAPKSVADTGLWNRLYGCLADDTSFTRPSPLETRPIPPLDIS